MHRRFIAFKYFNDYYKEGFEFINLNSTEKSDRKEIWKATFIIKVKDVLMRFGLFSPGILGAMLFKSEPDPLLIERLKKSGWLFKKLPRNPYI